MRVIRFAGSAGLLIGTLTCGSSDAQQIAAKPLVSYADGVLVTSEDVNGCPYRLVSSVSVNMRAHSYALKELEADVIASKLRKEAKKLAADAVILVTVGRTHMTMTSLRSTPITGRAISYVDRSCAPND